MTAIRYLLCFHTKKVASAVGSVRFSLTSDFKCCACGFFLILELVNFKVDLICGCQLFSKYEAKNNYLIHGLV